ncbi:MAG: isoprenyl transferase [Erysipelotrichaceae bacterium]|nr:isoprenyl transferase [Erysipelotrichaceae bacterium]
MNNVPQHVAIIMDGNGRWAKAQGKPRSFGHLRGTENVRNIAIKANELGVKVLTLYAFSTENWKRPAEEVNYLMGLPKIFIDRYIDELMEKGIRISMIGDIEQIPAETRKVLERAFEKTRNNKNMTLVFALNYGGRKEIVDGINRYVNQLEDRDHVLTEEEFSRYLYTADYPELELMIRTSLDYRISNFLLWQLSYAEMCFVDKYWPDFTGEDFENIINDFMKRHRRFGGLE